MKNDDLDRIGCDLGLGGTRDEFARRVAKVGEATNVVKRGRNSVG